MGVEVVFLCRFDGSFFAGVNAETNPAQFGFVYVRLKQDVNGWLLLAFIHSARFWRQISRVFDIVEKSLTFVWR